MSIKSQRKIMHACIIKFKQFNFHLYWQRQSVQQNVWCEILSKFIKMTIHLTINNHKIMAMQWNYVEQHDKMLKRVNWNSNRCENISTIFSCLATRQKCFLLAYSGVSSMRLDASISMQFATWQKTMEWRST